jgi:hypothetical protein
VNTVSVRQLEGLRITSEGMTSFRSESCPAGI